MNNQETLYDKRILDLEREINALKIAHYKTASTINTTTEDFSLSFSLYLTPDNQAWSTKRAVLECSNDFGSGDMISACYIKNITPDNYAQRYIYIQRADKQTDGKVRFEIYVYSQNATDLATLWGGGSVNLNYTVSVVASSKFSGTVSYKNIV